MAKEKVIPTDTKINKSVESMDVIWKDGSPFKNLMYQVVTNSSNVEAVLYCDKTLRVTFKGGSVYDYKKVPISVAREFMKAIDEKESAGIFLNRFVKGTYEYKKVI